MIEDPRDCYSVRFRDLTKDRPPTKEKHFTSADKRTDWIDKHADDIEVLAFADPDRCRS